jgi:hypothetical protein
MKRITFGAILALAIALGFAGCLRTGVQGSGVSKTEKRDLGAFRAIETQGAYEVQVTCRKQSSFEIEGDDNILPLIQTEVRDGVLYVTSSKSYSQRKTVSLRIALPDLESITSTGAGKISVSDVKNDRFEIHSTGAAEVVATGQTKTVVVRSTGAGEVDAHDLHAEKADVNAMGAASIDVYASEQLDVSMAGAGRVTYSGDPKVVNKNISGAGVLSKKE